MRHPFAAIRISPTQKAAITALTIVVLNGLMYFPPVYRSLGADNVLAINNLTNIAAALFGVWLGFRLWHSSRRGESQRLIWGCLLAGTILWILAEIVWDSYQLLRGVQQPSVSPADIGWILGYVAVISGLVIRLRTFRMRLTKTWQFAVLAAFAVVVILAVVYVVLPGLNDSRAAATGYDRFFGLFYAICDVVLAGLALLLVLVLEGGVLSRPWTAIAVGCFFIAGSNFLYAIALSRGMYQVNPAEGLDLLSYVIVMCYTFAYVMMALGLYLQARLLDAM